MRIAIVSRGRFHVADLARELASLGHDVTFYSDIPPQRLNQFGPRGVGKITLWPATILRVLQRMLPKTAVFNGNGSNRFALLLIDWLTRLLLRPCDVLIGMSGIVLVSAYYARQKYRARIWIERGSTHILAQNETLNANPNKQDGEGVDPWIIQRELTGYEFADRIVIPSQHVQASFVARGMGETKLFLNPYGVDHSLFPWSVIRESAQPALLMVGTWSWRKGCDVLTQALRDLPDIRFIHVGALADVPFPSLPNATHFEPVSAEQLSRFYRDAHLFVLASREDGFGVVLIQALSAGLSVIASDCTGGPDLRDLILEKNRIRIVSAGDSGELVFAIREMMPQAVRSRNVPLSSQTQEVLSWKRYGAEYDRGLRGTSFVQAANHG